MSNSAIGVVVTLGMLGLMVAAIIALGASKVADPKDPTCLAYMEADQRYNDIKKRHREAQERYQLAVINRGSSETATAEELGAWLALVPDDALERAKNQRREEYLSAYRGIRSSNADVTTKLLNADRWRCCKKFEPNRRVCPQNWL